MTTDRSTLETAVQSYSNLLDGFAEKLKHPTSLLFYSMADIMFLFKKTEDENKTVDFSVFCDFSENYSIIQM
jgi:hypothetical protein